MSCVLLGVEHADKTLSGIWDISSRRKYSDTLFDLRESTDSQKSFRVQIFNLELD